MDRSGIIKDLKVIYDAYVDYEKDCEAKWSEKNLEEHMDFVPQRPQQPVAPKQPKKPAYIKQASKKKEVTFEEYKESRNIRPIKITGLGWIVGAILFVAILIIFATELNIGLAILIASVTGVGYFGILGARASKLNKAQEERLSQEWANELENIKKENVKIAENNKKIEEQEKQYKAESNAYDTDYGKFLIARDKYFKDLDEYKAQWKEQAKIAEEKIKKHNDEIEEKAKNRLNKQIKGISIEFPEKYYSCVKDFISIFEDMRADTVKEAVSVYLDDQHKKQMLDAQLEMNRIKEEEAKKAEFAEFERLQEERRRTEMLKKQAEERMNFERQRAEQERYDRQRQAEAEQRERDRQRAAEQQQIEAAQRQCIFCDNRVGCPMRDKVTTVCPNRKSTPLI